MRKLRFLMVVPAIFLAVAGFTSEHKGKDYHHSYNHGKASSHMSSKVVSEHKKKAPKHTKKAKKHAQKKK